VLVLQSSTVDSVVSHSSVALVDYGVGVPSTVEFGDNRVDRPDRGVTFRLLFRSRESNIRLG
jgi:hypothetical protein